MEIIFSRGMNKASSPALKVDGSTRHSDGAHGSSGGFHRPSDGALCQNNGLSSPIDGFCRLRDGEPGQSGRARHSSDGSAGCCYGSSVGQTNFSAASNHSNEHFVSAAPRLESQIFF